MHRNYLCTIVNRYRTDSRHLPLSRLEKVQQAFGQLKINERFKELAALVNPDSINEKHSAFNDNKVTAHYAIVPTNKPYEHMGRPELESQLYEMIVRRFLGRFMPAAVYRIRKIILEDADGREYLAQEKILQEPGYLTIFKEDLEEDTKTNLTLPELKEEQKLTVTNYNLKEGKTRRPSLHTESSILSFMENAGKHIEDEDVSRLLKGKRIGTTATEHSFLPKLLSRQYIQSDQQGRFTTTSVGRSFIDAFPVDELKNPEFTAELEGGIESIKDKEITLDEFIQKSKELALMIISKMRKIPENVSSSIISNYNEQIEICSCLCKEGKLLDKGSFYGCNRHPECKVSFPKKIKGKTIPAAQIQKLFEKGTTDLIKGFKGENKEFDAFLVVENNKIEFRFPTAEDKSIEQCPKCKVGHIVPVQTKEGKKFFACSDYKSGCDFKFPHTLMNVKLPITQIKKFINDGQTDFINGFINGEGKTFTAALVANEDYSFKFKMPTKDDRTIGKCRLCGSAVLVGKQYYLCENYKKTCEFIIPGNYLGKDISVIQAKKLLEQNMTDLIKGFKKKDGSGTFDAKISYSNQEKRLTFIFPKKKA